MRGSRRVLVAGGAALALGLIAALALLRSSDSASVMPVGTDFASVTPVATSDSPAPVPTPESAPANPEPPIAGVSEGADRPATSNPGESTQGGAGDQGRPAPPSPPPQPPPSPQSQPTPIPCQVSVYAGPAPGVPNIRIVVTASPTIDVLWASVEEGGRVLRGAISITGGRGEQVVEGVSQAARVTVYSDPSLAKPTESCSTLG